MSLVKSEVPPGLIEHPVTGKRGHCYSACLAFQEKNREWTLVHGLAIRPTTGKTMGHAWCEKKLKGEWWVHDVSNGVTLPRALFYLAGKVRRTRRYRRYMAVLTSLRQGHYGPWVSELSKDKYHREPE